MTDTMERKINGFGVYWRSGRIAVERIDLTGRDYEVSKDRKRVRFHSTVGVAPENDTDAEEMQRAAEEFLRWELSFSQRGAEALLDRAARF